MIQKLDLSKVDKQYYKAQTTPKIVDLDGYFYISISGQSSPDDPKFLRAVEVLYACTYTVKFLLKADDNDFVVPKMEGLWYIAGGPENQKNFVHASRDEWHWKIMIRMPDFVESDHFHRAIESVKQKKPELSNVDDLKFELINEGTSAQILHHGSYDEEEPTIARLHDFIDEQGMQISGYHHEIYISDPRKTETSKLKTIIRYPITKK